MSDKPFRILGIQQIAIGGLDKQRLRTLWVDIFGLVLFLLPMSIIIMRLSWPVFVNAYQTGEVSVNAGGLIRWPARLMVPVGFFLLTLQGISELIKRIAFLMGRIPNPLEKHENAAIEQLHVDEEAAK